MNRKNKSGFKMYVCRSHVKARSLSEARRMFIKTEPDEIWISDDWKSGQNENLASAIGFGVEVPSEEE